MLVFSLDSATSVGAYRHNSLNFKENYFTFILSWWRLNNLRKFSSLIKRVKNLSRKATWTFADLENPIFLISLLSIGWNKFEKHTEVDKIPNLSFLYFNHQHLVNLINKLLRIFPNLRTMKLSWILSSEASHLRYRCTHIWFYRNNYLPIKFGHHDLIL